MSIDLNLPTFDQGAAAEPATKKCPKFSKQCGDCDRGYVTIIIDEVEGHPNFEKLGCNGFEIQVRRGEPVAIPKCFIGVLKNAVETILVATPHPNEPGRNQYMPKKRSSIPWRYA